MYLCDFYILLSEKMDNISTILNTYFRYNPSIYKLNSIVYWCCDKFASVSMFVTSFLSTYLIIPSVISIIEFGF